MYKIFEQCTVDGELTPELLKRKQELDQALELGLEQIEQNRSLTWVDKQRYSTDLQAEYEDIWAQELNDAGYVVRPMFESIEKPSFDDWYEELNKLN